MAWKFSTIKTVGVEAEGAFSEWPEASDRVIETGTGGRVRQFHAVEDGSLVGGVDPVLECRGFLRSRADLLAFSEWLESYDYTRCRGAGTHVHVCFVAPHHVAVWSMAEAQDELRAALVKKWPRVRRNTYDDHEYAGWRHVCDAERFACWPLEGFPTRYAAINFSSLEDHGTVEFRCLPAFTSARRLREAVSWFLGVVEDITRRYASAARPLVATSSPEWRADSVSRLDSGVVQAYPLFETGRGVPTRAMAPLYTMRKHGIWQVRAGVGGRWDVWLNPRRVDPLPPVVDSKYVGVGVVKACATVDEWAMILRAAWWWGQRFIEVQTDGCHAPILAATAAAEVR